MNELINKYQNVNFESLLTKKGYKFFTEGDFNLNIIGVRNLSKGNSQDNTFNDIICLIYKGNGKWIKYFWECTTDPGLKSLKQYTNTKGCAILVPNQYRGAYQIGFHQGKYEALVQRKPVQVYRDNDKDNILDFEPKSIENGNLIGINIHKAGKDSKIVDTWSQGCQVLKREADFNILMKICNKSKNLYGNSFTYTLITTNDLI